MLHLEHRSLQLRKVMNINSCKFECSLCFVCANSDWYTNKSQCHCFWLVTPTHTIFHGMKQCVSCKINHRKDLTSAFPSQASSRCFLPTYWKLFKGWTVLLQPFTVPHKPPGCIHAQRVCAHAGQWSVKVHLSLIWEGAQMLVPAALHAAKKILLRLSTINQLHQNTKAGMQTSNLEMPPQPPYKISHLYFSWAGWF